MKTQRGSTGTLPLFIFNLEARGDGCLTSCPVRFTPWKDNPYPLYRRLLVKAISITYSECVFVALVIQHAKGIFSSLGSLAVLYYMPLSHKRQDCRKKSYLKRSVLISSTTDTSLTLRRIQRDVIKNVHRSSCKVLVRF